MSDEDREMQDKTPPSPPIPPEDGSHADPDEEVDEASRESFPASDPPAFNPGKIG